MNWEGASALVTGAGGFIGSHLVEELARRGARVRAFVRYNSRHDTGLLQLLPPEVLKRIEVHEGDLRDPSAVLETMSGCEWVFHLGALIAIPYSYHHPREVVETNILGTFNVLESARFTRPRRVVHVSTSEVYGTARFVPITENHPVQGQSPYSASKIGADRLAESFMRSFGVPVVTVRPFNAYGPRQSARAVIPTIITQVLGGSVVRLGSLTPTRDFTFVRDTVRGMVRAAEVEDIVGKEINLGSGRDISIEALADRIMNLIGRRPEIVCEDVRLRPAKSEVERLLSDNSLAKQLLGWEPSVSLDDGLRETIAWIQAYLDRYRVGEYAL